MDYNFEFEQYKMAVEAGEKTTDRRNQSNTLYMTVVSIIFSALLLSFQAKPENNNNLLFAQLSLAFFGFFITFVWISHIEYCKKMIKLKFTTVKQLEDYLKLIPLYTKKDIGRKKISIWGQYSNNSRFEKSIPILFNIAFLALSLWKTGISNICFLIILILPILSGLYMYEAKVVDGTKTEDEIFEEILNFKNLN